MSKKYIMTEETKVVSGVTLHRIKAIRPIGMVRKDELGGWIEKEENLAHDGDAWIAGNAEVYGNARIFGNAWVCGNAKVSENAKIYGSARVYRNARVAGNAEVYDIAEVYDNAIVYRNARIYENGIAYENARVFDNARVYGGARIRKNAWIYDNASVYDAAVLSDKVEIYGNAKIYGDAEIYGNACVYGNAEVYGDALIHGDARVQRDAKVFSKQHIVWFSSVGLENGTLTAYMIKTGEIEIIAHRYFKGVLDEFEAAVKIGNIDNLCGKIDVQSLRGRLDNRNIEEYLALIQYIRLRFRGVTVDEEIKRA